MTDIPSSPTARFSPTRAVSRNLKRGGDIRERIQDEVAHRHSGMRQRQAGFVDGSPCIQTRSRSMRRGPQRSCRFAAHGLFDSEQRVEQLARGQLRQQPRGRIDEIRLILRAHRPGQVEARAQLERVSATRRAARRPLHLRSRVVEIAADRHIGGAPRRVGIARLRRPKLRAAPPRRRRRRRRPAGGAVSPSAAGSAGRACTSATRSSCGSSWMSVHHSASSGSATPTCARSSRKS